MKRAVLGPSLALILLACGPKEPPKQASTPDPIVGDEPGMSTGPHTSSAGRTADPAPPSGPVPKSAKGEAPAVASLASFQEGLRWGMSHADLTKVYTETNGVISKDYDDRLKKARVGPEMVALEAQREQDKVAFAHTFMEFKDTPTGYDASGIKGEFTYKNKEALMWIQRKAKKRFFFFINDRLWKIYDEVPLADDGPYGKAFLDAVNTLNAQLGSTGRVRAADAAKGISATTVDWKDATSHLRAVDRSREHIVGVAVEDANTVANLAALRPNKMEDPTAVDPSITAVTKGTNRTDPNATATPTPGGSAKPAAKPAPKKK